MASDFTKLAAIGSGGRSTATTILAQSVVRNLRREPTLTDRARKLLSFTDNRQDASLQAGHFNDFIELGLLRGAFFRAARDAGQAGVRHDELTQRVFDALALPLELYASNPSLRFQAEAETKRALRDVLGYRLYRDLQRGWRVTSPNLEQCGLLRIEYLSLDDLCRADDVWQDKHPALRQAAPEVRKQVATVLLDYMRRELAIKVDYLNDLVQERIRQQSSQRLIAPWGIDEDERLEWASVLYPRPQKGDTDYGGNLYLSPRGGFGQYLRRPSSSMSFSIGTLVSQGYSNRKITIACPLTTISTGPAVSTWCLGTLPGSASSFKSRSGSPSAGPRLQTPATRPSDVG
ncbi:MAG TPA: hypothetical protein VMV69_17435 [Pirellulales bacterium]|nr:hypothetical protein [Pirellulales bacterium]